MLKKFVPGLSVIVLLAVSFITGVRAQENKNIILATTTSVQDTGLLDVLTSAFTKKTGYAVKAIAVGTGQALQMGRLGEADILWVHSPTDEKQFVDEGYGINRTTFMHNDFVILGPENDPAKVLGVRSAVEAFKKIAAGKTLFVSRGDNSGTYKKEKAIWKDAGVSPDKDAYIEVGQGMAATVAIANEKKAYCLADRSSYVSLKKSINLLIVSEGDPLLINYYSLILVNPDKFSKINVGGAKALFDFLLSSDAKGIVESFGKEKFGKQLFFWDYQGR
jgi:tungstate transport system substrate-binding protein